MHEFITALYPLRRSITGEGLRETLRRVRERIPIVLHEVPSGTQVFDWTVPPEWNLHAGWIRETGGASVVDVAESSLHVVGYSTPVSGRFRLDELRAHLHTLPERPDWVPYRTSYYRETWGFCLGQRRLDEMRQDEYDVLIDATLAPGSLTYGELEIPGRKEEEVLLSCHVCHPALCNDNLSGLALVTELAEVLLGSSNELSYRIILIPGTIGSITWLARNESRVGRIRHGLVVANVGDPGPFHYKRTRRGHADIDRTVEAVLKDRPEGFEASDFSPYGYDERQYNSPGFSLPVGCLTRTPHGRFAEYHTSADDLNFVRPEALSGSLGAYLAVIDALDADRRYFNTNPRCEPQLGRRGLYRTMGGFADAGRRELAMLWLLNLSDGSHSLLDVAERSGLPFGLLAEIADSLQSHGLLTPAAEGGS